MHFSPAWKPRFSEVRATASPGRKPVTHQARMPEQTICTANHNTAEPLPVFTNQIRGRLVSTLLPLLRFVKLNSWPGGWAVFEFSKVFRSKNWERKRLYQHFMIGPGATVWGHER